MQNFFTAQVGLEQPPPSLTPTDAGQRGHSTRANPGPSQPSQSQPAKAQASQSQAQACQPDQPVEGDGGKGPLPAEALRGSRSSSSSSSSSGAGGAAGRQPIERRHTASLYSNWPGRPDNQPMGRKMKQQNRSRKFK